MKIDVLALIDRLEALVSSGTRVPLTSKALVDEQEFLELVDQLRVAMPDEIRHAKRVSQDRDRVLSQAQVDADKILSTARDRAEQLVREADVVRTAQQRADDMLRAATEEAGRMRGDADRYAVEVLDGLEAELGRLLASIKKGKAALEKMSEERALLDDGDVSPIRAGRLDRRD